MKFDIWVFAKLRNATVSFVMSVRLSAWKNSSTTGRIFMKFDIWVFAKLRNATVSFVMSVRLSAWKNSSTTGQIFMKFDIWVFENLSRKFDFHSNLTRITGSLHEEQKI